jgi:hypothetical protein
MKRVVIFIGFLATLIAATPAVSAADEGMIAGAGAGAFPTGAVFAGIPLTGLEFGQGVLTASDGSAVGAFHAVLQGGSLVSVDGTVATGGVTGIATFAGTATVRVGGGVPLPGVPFQVALTGEGLQLTLDGTLLPAVTVAPGAIAIE